MNLYKTYKIFANFILLCNNPNGLIFSFVMSMFKSPLVVACVVLFSNAITVNFSFCSKLLRNSSTLQNSCVDVIEPEKCFFRKVTLPIKHFKKSGEKLYRGSSDDIILPIRLGEGKSRYYIELENEPFVLEQFYYDKPSEDYLLKSRIGNSDPRYAKSYLDKNKNSGIISEIIRGTKDDGHDADIRDFAENVIRYLKGSRELKYIKFHEQAREIALLIKTSERIRGERALTIAYLEFYKLKKDPTRKRLISMFQGRDCTLAFPRDGRCLNEDNSPLSHLNLLNNFSSMVEFNDKGIDSRQFLAKKFKKLEKIHYVQGANGALLEVSRSMWHDFLAEEDGLRVIGRDYNGIIKNLLVSVDNIDLKDEKGLTALEYACAVEDFDLAKALVNCGAKIPDYGDLEELYQDRAGNIICSQEYLERAFECIGEFSRNILYGCYN